MYFTETDNQNSINKLPDEMLLLIFRNVPAKVFITVLPFVCKRWWRLIKTDTFTLKQIAMVHSNHSNPRPVVDYFYTGPAFDNYMHLPPATVKDLMTYKNSRLIHEYSDAVYSCIRYSDNFYKHISVLEIKCNLGIYPTAGFTYLENLTTLIFCEVSVKLHSVITFAELSSVYPNIQNITYIECTFSTLIDLTFLHYNFRNLRRFRLDHHVASDRFLENLLNTNHDLETIIFRNCVISGDRWLDILLDKLKGRTITNLSIHSPYFTFKGVYEFLRTDTLKLNKSKVNISNDQAAIVPFHIDFV